MPSSSQTNNNIRTLNRRVDLLQNTPGLRFNTREVVFNTLIGEKTKSLNLSLSRQPRQPWSVNVQSTSSQSPPRGFSLGTRVDRDGDTIVKTIGSINGNTYNLDIYEFTRDTSPVEVLVFIESPNPELIEITPEELTFTRENWNVPQKVEFKLLDNRTRYATEYYDNVKVSTQVITGNDESYDENEFYIDIQVLSSNQRSNFFKGREIYSEESFKHPVNFSSEKLIKIKAFQIIGCIVGGHLTHNPVVQFGDSFYNANDPDVLNIIASLSGTDPNLITIPGDIPQYATPNSPPLDDTEYAILGVDGRIFQSNGNPSILSGVSKFPSNIEISISDKKFYNFNLGDFATISSPPPVSGQVNFGPLNNAVVEVEVNEEFPAEDLMRLLPNGDASFYIYGKLTGNSSDWMDIWSWANTGFHLYRPFMLRPIIEHTENIWDTHRGEVTHTFYQRADASVINYVGSSNTYDKKSGYTIFNKSFFAPELYYKQRLNDSGSEYTEMFLEDRSLYTPDTQFVEETLDNSITNFDYYNSYSTVYPPSSGWYRYVETPYVRVDFNGDIPYIYLNDQLESDGLMVRRVANDVNSTFVFDDSLDEDVTIECDTDLIQQYNMRIVDFN